MYLRSVDTTSHYAVTRSHILSLQRCTGPYLNVYIFIQSFPLNVRLSALTTIYVPSYSDAVKPVGYSFPVL